MFSVLVKGMRMEMYNDIIQYVLLYVIQSVNLTSTITPVLITVDDHS